MPANRSRTQEWRRCLAQIHDRGGAIEIAVAPFTSPSGSLPGRDLVWRVRILDISATELFVEQPTALGRAIPLQQGVELIAILAIGQNRWTFQTRNLGCLDHRCGGGPAVPAMRLVMPETVERCQRRNYYRIETGGLNVPAVDLWPLLDPESVLLAERANELQAETGDAPHDPEMSLRVEEVMPEIGPQFSGLLLNIGGGGVGLLIEPDDGQMLAHHKTFWMRLALPPHLTVPICATGKLVHTHMESTQRVYAGMAFDFSFNPAHQRFVVDQICRYIAMRQRDQMSGGERQREPTRRSA